ncbi:hypothetical protein F2981_16255 [Sinorhizobium meliloti]|nr:hypothetical protein [Sinorhizobium meliloti]
MADRIIVYWRDIPAQVIIKQAARPAKRELSCVSPEAIDMCAMRTGAARPTTTLPNGASRSRSVSDDLEAEADRAAAELGSAYDRGAPRRTLKAGGRDNA